MSTPLLRSGDLEAMRRAHAIVANSIVTRDRIRSAYGLDSVVVSPPVERVSASPTPPARVLPDQFVVVVARDARVQERRRSRSPRQREAGLPIVVVGAGSEMFDDPWSGVHGLGRLTDAELSWVYRTAVVVLGAGHEDFGLTVIEAALEGTPAADDRRRGGYLETVMPGVSGFHAAADDAEGLAAAIQFACELERDGCREWAGRFSEAAHRARLMEVLGGVAR